MREYFKPGVLIWLLIVLLIPTIGLLVLADNNNRGIGSCQFKLISWNVADLFELKYDDTNQWGWINTQLPDIVALCEDFNKCIYNPLRQYYNYGESYYNESSQFPPDVVGSGLSFLCGRKRLGIPINYYISAFRPWSSCSSDEQFDCASFKGFAYFQLFFPLTTSSGYTFEMPIDYYVVHLDAGRSSADHDARAAQLSQLKSFMDTYSVGKSAIISGDFNCAYQDTIDKTNLLSFMAGENLSFGNNPNIFTTDSSTLDYVLYRSGDPRESLNVINCGVDQGSLGLSDHLALNGIFSFAANYDSYPDLVITDILSFEFDPLSQIGNARIVVHNNGPSQSQGYCNVYMTIDGIKWNYGIGGCPPLSSGQSAIVDVEYEIVLGKIKLTPQNYNQVRIVATIDRDGDMLKSGQIRENNEKNNTFYKIVPINWIN